MSDPTRRPSTTLVTAGRPPAHPAEPLNVPVVLASNFRNHEVAATVREYSRTDSSPGWEALEDIVGTLEGGDAVAFSSGMAAASAVIDLTRAGGRVVVGTDTYLGVRGQLADGEALGRWTVDVVDVTDTDAVLAAIPGADLVWLESPTNPMLDVADLPVLCRAAREAGALVAVDNTFATPLLQQPLALGAHVVVHSATKFIGGHSDLLMGVAIAESPEGADRLRRRRVVSGATPGALESFLAVRGARTLGVRLAQSQASAGELATRLAAHPAVTRVRYPGLASDPGHERAAAQMSGFGAMVSWEVADAATAEAVCAGVRVLVHATSLGGVESTIERRGRYAGQAHVPAGLMRMSVGIEDVEDLWDDLDAALKVATA